MLQLGQAFEPPWQVAGHRQLLQPGAASLLLQAHEDALEAAGLPFGQGAASIAPLKSLLESSHHSHQLYQQMMPLGHLCSEKGTICLSQLSLQVHFSRPLVG